MYMPGNGVNIKKPTNSIENKNIIIFAWRFNHEILEKHHYLKTKNNLVPWKMVKVNK